MPRLIHLNGPSGIGKSTIAQMYADRHPGVLNLDTDHVVSLIGGWQENFWTALVAARQLAISMAQTHLQTGHDVVMPQLVTRHAEIEGFETATNNIGSEYVEIALTSEKHQALARFAERNTHANSPRQHQLDQVIAQNGGPILLARIHDHLTEYLQTRPHCRVLDAGGHNPDRTYAALDALLTAP
ncbi:hypothetical protein B2J88_48765 [Rhodococcus sp. SRB_17]|nr:hypothetical protein [Rhodococcus sp. SRB_17]